MAIKMRVSKNDDAVCCSCGDTRKFALDLFDVSIGNTIITICDRCMDEMVTKSIRAVSFTNGRVKEESEIKKINFRSRIKGKDYGKHYKV